MSAAIVGSSAITKAGVGVAPLYNAVLSKAPLMENGLAAIGADTISELKAFFPQYENHDVPTLLAVASVKLAMKEAGWTQLDNSDVIIFASTVGLGPVWEDPLCNSFSVSSDEARNDLLTKTLSKQPIGNLSSNLCQALDFNGRSYLISSACTAGTQAAGFGAKLVETKQAKRCLVVGVEVFCRLTIEGFKSLRLLSEEVCMPFDENRTSINLSEAAACLCLELRDDDSHFSKIVGFGMSSDAFHAASPEPSGEGITRAMNLSLEDANVSPSNITWVHCHGTGSPANDTAEAKALSQIFNNGESPLVCSTKGIHGHSLAASGVLELALVDYAMKKQTIFGNHPLNKIEEGILCNLKTEAETKKTKHLLKSTLGFGGANASVILEGPQ